jgi:hypothetical protein
LLARRTWRFANHEGEARCDDDQQASPQARPSSHVVGDPPPRQAALHGTESMQWTRQLPVHFTSQLLEEVQVTSLPSPTVGPQSLTFRQVYVQWAPHVAAQVVVPVHETLHRSPHVTVQPGPLMQSNLQLLPQVASQLLPKSLHVGEHICASPQSRLALPPHCEPMQAHIEALQGTTVVLSFVQAKRATTIAAGMAREAQRADTARC